MQRERTGTALHAIVRGLVQGVGFRAWVVARARALGCTGWVRNLSDGRSVEVFAEGSEAALNALAEALHQGPLGAHVAEVRTERLPATGAFSDFSVLR
jgi:acylphosphatase